MKQTSSTIRYIILILLLFSTSLSYAQYNKKTTRILFLLDGSSSMTETWQEKMVRFEAAKFFISSLADSITKVNKDVEFGLRVLGHQHGVPENNCYDSKLEVGFSKLNNEQLSRRLKFIHPQGVSPIAWSLQQSAQYDFELNTQYIYSLILITDGGESCNGDICATMTNIVNKKISFTPYIISLIDYEPLRQEYDCMGEYLVVKDKPSMASTIKQLMEKNKNFVGDENTKYIPKTVPTPPVVITPTPTPPPPAPTVSVAPKNSIGKLTFSTLRYYIPYKISWNIKSVAVPKLPKINVPTEPTVAVITPPTPTPTPTPVVSVVKQNIPALSIKSAFKKLAINGKIDVPNKVAIKPLPKTKVPEEAPVITKQNIDKLLIGNKYARLSYTARTPFSKVAIQPLPKITVPEEQPVLVKTNISKIPLNISGKRMNYMFSIATAKPIKVPALPKITIYASDLVITNTRPNPTPSLPTSTPNITTSNPIVTSEPKTNSLDPGTFQLFFTNGQGKYYNTEPPLEVIDIKTNKQVWKGERRLDANKQPKPIKIPDGSYVVQVIGSTRKANVTIEKGTNKKVEILVNKGSLSFGYKNSNEKPVGFVARVSKRFEPGPIVDHPTDQVLPYESANYHIEVNTMPPSLFNVDLIFDINTQITLTKAGTVQIINEDELGRVEFWYQLGENYLRFYEMNILGDIENQKVEFKAGPYMVKYRIRNEKGQIVEKSHKFILYADQTEQLLLQ